MTIGYLQMLTSEKYDDSTGERQTAYRKSIRRIFDLMYPWAASTETDEATQEKVLINAWYEAWGDPNDPEVKAKIERTIAFLQR
mgnify:FL=1